MEINVSIDQKIYKSHLKINQTLICTNKNFFFSIICFTQSHSYSLDDIDDLLSIDCGII